MMRQEIFLRAKYETMTPLVAPQFAGKSPVAWPFHVLKVMKRTAFFYGENVTTKQCL